MNSPTAADERPLRIAIVHAADVGGGAERSTLTLHQTLRQMGHDCRMFVGAKETDEPGVIAIPRPRPFPGIMRIARIVEDDWGWQNFYTPWFRKLHQAIGEVDVVHIHSIWGGRYPFADLTGVRNLANRYPTVMTLRDGWMLTGHCATPTGCDRWKTGCGSCPDLQRIPAITRDATAFNWKRKQRTIQSVPIRITTVSHWLKSQVALSPIFANKQVDVVHNSVDDTHFHRYDQRRARQELGLPETGFLALMAGQCIEGFSRKIAQDAVTALNQLAEPGIVPLLVGRPAQDVAATLKLPSLTLPYQQDPRGMARCYQAADITIVPSEYETFGRVAAESLCCGTPVVAYDTGGLPEIVRPGISGWIVPSGDIAGLARVLGEVYRSQSQWTPLRATCAKWAVEQFHPSVINDQYLRVYRSLKI